MSDPARPPVVRIGATRSNEDKLARVRGGSFELTDAQRAFRDEVGLPTDRAVVLSGHQASFWHGGVLAKLFAATRWARGVGGSVGWVVVDQDDPLPLTMELPARDPDGRLGRVTWVLADRESDGAVPGSVRAPLSVRAPRLGPGWALPDVIRERASDVMAALERHDDAPSLAAQVTGALFDLVSPAVDAPVIVPASQVVRTTAFEAFVDRCRRAPREVFAAYNAAVAGEPGSGVRPLTEHADGRLELPLWSIGEGGERVAVTDHSLRTLDAARVLPRALLMTALFRAGGCELFVHGTGGAAYEPINDRGWTGGGPPAAPFVGVTADVMLSMDGVGVSRAEARRARWRAHHARHHPGEVGDADAQAVRDGLLVTIDKADRGSAARAEAFGALHAHLAAARARNAGELDALVADARRLGSMAADVGVSEDRTWSVALHDADTLRSLDDAVRATIDGAGG